MTKTRPGRKKTSAPKTARKAAPARSRRGAAPRKRTARPALPLRPTDSVPSRNGAASKRYQESRAAAEAAIEAALDKKALMPVLLDVSERASYTDFIGVVSGRSDRQVDAIAEHVREVMGRLGFRLLGREGAGNGRWTLLDFGDVVLHVFYHPVREVYDIEGLWIDAPRVRLEVPPEAQLYQSDALYGAL